MKNYYPAKSYVLGTLFFLLLSTISYSQVGINTTTPVGGSMLDITSTDKGILVPRIVIDDLSTIFPVVGGSPESLLAYNTSEITEKGYYYWNGSRWVGLDGERDWKLEGNAGTSPGTNFIGTTDAQDVVIKANNTERVRIGITETVINEDSNDYDFRIETNNDANTIFVDGANDNVGVGTNIPAVDVKLEVNGGSTNGIYGYSDNVGGYLGRETNITIGLPGNTQSISGAGVYANNPLGGYTSVFAQSTGAATVAANVNYSDVWMANYSYVDNSNVGYNPSAMYVQLNKNEASTGGDHAALKALSTREVGGNPGNAIGIISAVIPGALSGTQTENAYGIIAQATNTAGENAYGGQFAGIGGGAGYIVTVADDFNNRKIIGTGSVSEVIPTENHGRIILTAPESPEYWYQDYGTVQMVNGVAIIKIDPILSDIIVVDNQNPVRVICTPYQMPYFNGVTIMKYSKTTVEIRELNGGKHSGTLQYQLVAKPRTNYGEGRFPQAEGPYFAKGIEMPKARTSNQHNRDNVFEWPADWEVYGYENIARQYISGEKLIETMDNKDKK